MSTSLRIESLPGYAPTIGRLVGMLTYARETLVAAVGGLGQRELDHLHDASSNSIGALLAHAAAVERYYQVLTFEDREPSADEEAAWAVALDLGEPGRQQLRGRDLPSYLDDLATTRNATLAALARWDDVWLERPLVAKPAMNAHWAWFHVAEDEINHRGQIRWLRARLPAGDGPGGMKLAATVLYVDRVPLVLDFYRRAFGLEPSFVDLDVQLPGRREGGRYEFASIEAEGGTLQFGTHALGALLMPIYSRSAAGVVSGAEIAFYTRDVEGAYRRAVDAGAVPVSEPGTMPWGQTVAYVRSIEGTFVGICSPLPDEGGSA